MQGQSRVPQSNKQEMVQNGVAVGPLTPTLSPPCPHPKPAVQPSGFWVSESCLLAGLPIQKFDPFSSEGVKKLHF